MGERANPLQAFDLVGQHADFFAVRQGLVAFGHAAVLAGKHQLDALPFAGLEEDVVGAHRSPPS